MGKRLGSVFGLSVVFALLLSLAGCGSSTQPSTINLSGNWSGTVTASPVTWTVTQNGTSVTGPFVSGVGRPNPLTGTMSGTVSGTQALLTLVFPAGAFTSAGSSTCTISITTTASVSAS